MTIFSFFLPSRKNSIRQILNTIFAITIYHLLFILIQQQSFHFTSFSNKSAAGNLQASKADSNFSVICRILSNDLTPLHGNSQTFLNTVTILNQEKLPLDFRRHWIINCIMDKMKEKALIRLFKSRGETYDVIRPKKPASTFMLLNEALNVNRARNFGLFTSFQMGANWVYILDGASFLTSESLESITNITRNSSSDQTVFFIPMVRLQYKIDVSMSLTYENLFPFISGQQEVQLAFNRHYLASVEKKSLLAMRGYKDLIFDERRRYSRRNKLQLVRNIQKSSGSDHIFCKSAMIGWERPKSKNFQHDMELIRKCGYVLRLLYHPETEADLNQTLKADKRTSQRFQSMKNFRQKIEASDWTKR